jgi:hypothetical protein
MVRSQLHPVFCGAACLVGAAWGGWLWVMHGYYMKGVARQEHVRA